MKQHQRFRRNRLSENKQRDHGRGITLQKWIKEVARGKRGSKDLTYQQTREAAEEILNGKATDAQIAAYFVAQRLKTESPEELLAFVHALRGSSEKLPVSESLSNRVVDFAGPYNGRNSFAATIPVSILLADFGIPVFLHSSDSLPPKYGTALKEIISGLGINVHTPGKNLVSSMEDTGLGFAWTEKFCPPLEELRHIREEIGVRTLLNTAEKLLNLAGSNRLMMGAFHRTAINKIVPLLHGLTYEKVYIVQGMEGSEDVPVHRNSFLFELTKDSSESTIIKPADYGLLDKSFDDRPLSAMEQQDIILAVLGGESGNELQYYINQVLLNTGLRYYLFGASVSIEEGISIAREQLRSKAGLRKLNQWKKANSLSQSVL